MTVDSNMERAFLGLIFEFNTGNKSDKLLFSEKQLTTTAGFQKPWSNDLALDHLSIGLDSRKFDWINK
jgi:hypothetical protein